MRTSELNEGWTGSLCVMQPLHASATSRCLLACDGAPVLGEGGLDCLLRFEWTG